MVLSNLLTHLLTKALGDYLKPGCFQEDSFRVGLWRGHVELFNVCLKDDILDLLGLPITLRFARIGHIEIQIPWNQLGGKPVVVKIEQVHVLAYAKYQWEEGANERRLEAIKQAQLRAAEEKAEDISKDFGPTAKEAAAAAAAGPAGGGAGGGGTSWLMNNLLNKVLDRIQIEVRDVHIRFEDLVSSPSLPYCLGLTLELFKVSKQDPSRVGHALRPAPRKFLLSGGGGSGDGVEGKDEKGGGKEVLKVAQIDYLSVYCNPVSNDDLVSMALHELEGDEEVDVMLARLLPRAPLAPVAPVALPGVGLGVGKGRGISKVGRRKEGKGRIGRRADWKEEEEEEGEEGEEEQEEEEEDEDTRRQRQAAQDADRLGGHMFLLHPARSTSYFWLGSQAQEPGSSQRTRVMRALLGLDRLTITLEDHLLRSVLCLSAGLIRFQTMNRLGVKRPRKGVREDPRAWWRYAYEVVLVKLHEHRGKYDWSSVLRRREARLRYVKCWKKWVRGRYRRREEGEEEHEQEQEQGEGGEEEEEGSQSESEEEEEEAEERQVKQKQDRLSRKIKELEAHLSYKDILLYRKLAEAQLKEEGVAQPVEPSTELRERWLSLLRAADLESADPAVYQRRRMPQ